MFQGIRLMAWGLTGLVCTAALADHVELVNGDTLTGTILSEDDNAVVIDHPVLGQIELAADRVKLVHRDAPEPNPAPTPQPAPVAAPEPEPEPTPPPAPVVDPAEVQAAAEEAAAQQALDERSMLKWFMDEWNTKLSLGFNGAAGNTDTHNFFGQLNAKHQDGRNRWMINSQWFYGLNRGQVNRSQFQTTVTRDWLQQGSPWFFFVRGEYKYDRFRNWENRTSGFVGTGYALVKNDRFEVNARMGLGGTYDFGSINEFTPEALFGGSILKWKISDRSAISGESVYYPSLEDTADYRITTRLEWTYKLDLASGMSIKLGAQSDYDGQTNGDREHNDLKYYGALVLEF